MQSKIEKKKMRRRTRMMHGRQCKNRSAARPGKASVAVLPTLVATAKTRKTRRRRPGNRRKPRSVCDSEKRRLRRRSAGRRPYSRNLGSVQSTQKMRTKMRNLKRSKKPLKTDDGKTLQSNHRLKMTRAVLVASA
jgi:hypothetical protein